MNKNKLPEKWNYGDYSSDNYGAHTIAIDIPASRSNKFGIRLYFSYDTLIAFRGYVDGRIKTYARVNEWKSTTGHHLNLIGVPKNERLEEKEFNKVYNKALRNA